MIKYSYACEQDKTLVTESFNNLAFLILGRNDSKRIDIFRDYFKSRVSQVNVYPQGTVTKHLNNNTPGICRLDDNRKKLIIEMLGYKYSNEADALWIKHEGTHELCHGFVDLLPELMAKRPEGIIKNGVLYKNHMGMIKEMDPITGQLVGQHFYGKMVNETMMDIITSISINCFVANGQATTADEVLQLNFNDWGNATTGYSIFTSITRLVIAAFSNNGFANYQNIINQGFSMFNGRTTMENGESYKINDFLYGIVFDPLHIEEAFDKFMGEGSYRTFSKYLDRLFVMSLKGQKLPSEEVKKIMNVLPDFLNRKINYYRQNGIIDSQGASRIVENFNQIWNSMQKEYGAYFTEQDINDIANRAGRS